MPIQDIPPPFGRRAYKHACNRRTGRCHESTGSTSCHNGCSHSSAFGSVEPFQKHARQSKPDGFCLESNPLHAFSPSRYKIYSPVSAANGCFGWDVTLWAGGSEHHHRHLLPAVLLPCVCGAWEPS